MKMPLLLVSLSSDSWVDAFRHASVEEVLLRVLVQLAVIILIARLFGVLFRLLGQLGLIFLLFLVGMEFDFGHLRWHGRSALAISVSGFILPFVLGIGLAMLMRPYVGEDTPALGFTLFLGTALSITAVPVLGRI